MPIGTIGTNRCVTLVVVVTMLLAAAGTKLDAQAVRATIQGTVSDQSGAALPGATVEVRNIGTGVVQTAVTNGQGRFSVPELIPGDYVVQASLQGFQTVVQQGVALGVGAQRVVDFKLPIGALEETLTVQGASAQVEVVSSAISTRIEQKQISELPLNGRNFAQLVTLAPGVENDVRPSSRLGRQAGISVAGSRPEGQAFLLDNVKINNYMDRAAGSGVLGTTLGVESIAEFQTLTNTYSAQFGGSGAVINALTKSGANALHGSLFEYMRDDALDAKGYFDATRNDFSKNQFGVSLGGPVRRDRAFFFFNYEGLVQREGISRIVTVPDADARRGIVNGVNVGVDPYMQQIMGLYPLPTRQTEAQRRSGVGQTDVVANQTGHEHYFVGRVDYTPTANDTLFARFVSDTAFLYEPYAGSSIPLWPGENDTDNKYLTAEHRRILSTTRVNQLRFGYTDTYEQARNIGGSPLLDFGGRTNGSINPGGGLTSIGAQQLNPFNQRQRRLTFADDMFWTSGNHGMRFGGHVERNVTDIDQPFQSGLAWTFSGLQSFLTKSASQVVGALPPYDNAARSMRSTNIVGYFQDDWRAHSTLTLNLGVRYEFATNPHIWAIAPDGSEISATAILRNPITSQQVFDPVDHPFEKNPSLKNIDPRLGFAWTPFGEGTSIRGGFGLFHAVIPVRSYAPGYYLNPPFYRTQQQFPSFPDAFGQAGFQPAVPSNGTAFDWDAANTTPFQVQWNVNVQRELFEATILTVGYVGSSGHNLWLQREVNPSVPSTTASGQTVYGTVRGATATGVVPNPRINTSIGSFAEVAPVGHSKYHSLQASLNRRFYQNLQSQLSYTWASCKDIGSGTYGIDGGGTSSNPYDLEYDLGRCGFSRDHTFSGSGVYALPFSGNPFVSGWQLSSIVRLSTGVPFSPGIGFDQSGLGGGRPNLAPGRDINKVVTGGINRYFDPTAFTLPAPGTLGDVGRNALLGPGKVDVDFSIVKDTRISSVSDSFNVQFRIEVFNLLNRPNFSNPNANIFTQTAGGGGAYSGTAGQITSTASPMRQIQLAVKLLF